MGREVAILVNDVKGPGEYPTTWDASSYSSGVYFYKLEAGSYSEVKKLLLIRCAVFNTGCLTSEIYRSIFPHSPSANSSANTACQK